MAVAAVFFLVNSIGLLMMVVIFQSSILPWGSLRGSIQGSIIQTGASYRGVTYPFPPNWISIEKIPETCREIVLVNLVVIEIERK